MKTMIAIILAAALLLAFGCAGQAQGSLNTSAQGQVEPGAGYANNSSMMADNRTGYDKTNDTIALAIADGTYSEMVQYKYHEGKETEATETVEINVTVGNDTITAVSVAGINAHPYSAKLIGDYNAALPDLVIGKKITEIDLPKNVAGSSLTNAAFKAQLGALVEKY